MSRNPSQFQPHKTATIRPASVFPPATAAAIRRSAWQVTATLLAMLILITVMAVLSPKAFPQVPPLPNPAVQQEAPLTAELPHLAQAPEAELALTAAAGLGHRPDAPHQRRTDTMKLWGAGIMLLIGLRLLADSPRPRVLRL